MTRVLLLLLVAALACACAGETLLDVDFAAATRRVDAEGVGSFHGVLPAHVSENFSGWSAGRATSAVCEEGGRRFLRLETKPGEAGGQFAIGGFEPTFPGFFRLRVTGRVARGGTLSLGLRLHGEPYTGFSQHAFASETWTERTFLFPVNRKREGNVGLYFYTGPGVVELGRIVLETATEADLAAEIPRPPKSVRAFVRHARFPLGLPCGWNLGRDCVGTTCVADREEPAADGVPVLKVVSETPWELRGEAFQTGYPGETHMLSFSYRAAEPVQVGVVDERGRVVAGRTVPASADWREERIAFRAPMLARSLGLRFAGARGPFRLDRVGVCVGTGSEDGCAVALAAVKGEIAAETRIQFVDEPARVAFRVLGAPKGSVLKATATDLYGRTRPLAVPAGTEGELEYGVFPEAPLGQFRISAWLEQDGKTVSGEEELVVTRLARPVAWGRDAPDSPFGCHFNPNRGVVRTMKAGGVNWVRLHDAGETVSNWHAQEPERGRWNFHDAEVAVYRNAGMKIFAQLGTAPKWATHYGDLGYTWLGYFEKYLRPTNMVDWVNYVTRYVKHHERNIDEYFVWNEPWGQWWASAADIKYYDKAKAGADFAALQRLAYDAVKRVNPKIRVAGFNTTSGVGGRTWTEDVLAGGGFDCCDIVDWHYYTSHPRGRRGEATISNLPLEPIRRRHPDLGGKPFYMSEGQGTSNGSAWISERMSGLLKASVPWPAEGVAQYSRLADLTCRYVVSLLAEGNAKVYLYSAHAYSGLAQVPTFLTLLGADGFAHPALVAHAQLARALEGTRFVRKEDAGGSGVKYVFAGARGTVVVYSNLAQDEVLARAAAEPLLDLYGNRVTAATYVPGTLVYEQKAY